MSTNNKSLIYNDFEKKAIINKLADFYIRFDDYDLYTLIIYKQNNYNIYSHTISYLVNDYGDAVKKSPEVLCSEVLSFSTRPKTQYNQPKLYDI